MTQPPPQLHISKANWPKPELTYAQVHNAIRRQFKRAQSTARIHGDRRAQDTIIAVTDFAADLGIVILTHDIPDETSA